MQKITPFLWFDDKAEEAVNFYVSVFKNSKIGGITRYGEEGAEVSGRPKGTVMTVEFQSQRMCELVKVCFQYSSRSFSAC